MGERSFLDAVALAAAKEVPPHLLAQAGGLASPTKEDQQLTKIHGGRVAR